ncbi:CRP-like cAMP-binding protein [Kutzneria kofuensis]|uniref:CRP-like cAMP-binding protein n=2 Tax=Kutzneria kofuensis TaxID=103725 RepID=A0A7W9KLM6_9PSEU|nr:CRP-like cAMP-binding protein [Kutzneria kofuensis]
MRQGYSGGYLLALTGGRVQVLRSEQGGEQRLLVALRAAGDLVGEMAAHGGGGVRSASVVALDDCYAHYLTVEAFDRLPAARKLTDYVVLKLSESVPFRVQLVHFKPPQRIARLLAELVMLAGPELADPMLIPLSQEQIATALGVARSSVSSFVADLRREGVLGPGPRLTVADPERLLRYTSERV